ncbi:hypothetical protein [Sphingomonas abietis]|uniref:Uncharacterized protein n=1 Tax=Sphingomonas abietis TaxID=3012344 RepID=A0ABY7NJH4_9SPHN|nr:hypothetical protein [Sphingomonas abietis]WBO21483.1 hypothetical protein PBT88_15015 [Sphingomonas abietis]
MEVDMKRMARFLVISLPLGALSSVTAPAFAGSIFEAVNDPAPIIEGGRGQSHDVGGIAVYSDGLPAGKYKVVGMIRDDRVASPATGNPLRSQRIAHLAKAKGGNGVLYLGQVAGTHLVSEREEGGAPFASLATGTDYTHSEATIESKFLVIKSAD